MTETGVLSFTLSVSGLKTGTATITASATDERVTSCTVTVQTISCTLYASLMEYWDRDINYTATTTSSKGKEAYIVAALYDGSGELLETKMSPLLTLEKGKRCEGYLHFTNELTNPKVVKVFLLDENNYAPLCDAVSPSLSAN